MSNLDNEAAMMMDELMMMGGKGEMEGAGQAFSGLPVPPTTPVVDAPRSPIFRLDNFTELESILLDAVLQTCAGNTMFFQW